MELLQLNIHSLRNLNSVEFETDSGFNIFYGENGAGKTSILEAVHLLSHGRSFRSSRINPLIQHQKSKLRVTGKVREQYSTYQLGVERSKRGILARINGANVQNILKLSECFPTLAMHPNTFNFLSEEPAQRRSFIDWGVFYENSRFVDNWRSYKKALKQRNAALRQGLGKEHISIWNEPLAEAGESINSYRKIYVSNIIHKLPELMFKFKQSYKIDMVLKAGWPEGISLLQALEDSIEKDIATGYTHAGVHRADLKVSLNSHPVSLYASRGQLKLVTVLLKLAQCSFLVKENKRSCVLILDDLSAELDKKYFLQLLDVVAELKLQAFLSTIDPIENLLKNRISHKLFHVEHGLVKEMV